MMAFDEFCLFSPNQSPVCERVVLYSCALLFSGLIHRPAGLLKCELLVAVEAVNKHVLNSKTMIGTNGRTLSLMLLNYDYTTHSKQPAYLNVVDIAGLVKGASEGQGLGNAFLSHIRACDALFHLCRESFLHMTDAPASY